MAGMFRIRRRKYGGLSDMVNLSRAVDAAEAIALADLNSEGGICPVAASPMRFPRRGLAGR